MNINDNQYEQQHTQYDYHHPTLGALYLGKYLYICSAINPYVNPVLSLSICCTLDLVSMMNICSRGTPALWYAIASFSLFPNPPMNGLLVKSPLMRFIRFDLMPPVCLVTSFLTAGKNSSGSISSTPSHPTVSLMYVLEYQYNAMDRIVSHTILYPLAYTLLINQAQLQWRQFLETMLWMWPPMSFLVRVPSTSETNSLSLSEKRCISADNQTCSSLKVNWFAPKLSFIFLIYWSDRYWGVTLPLQSNPNVNPVYFPFTINATGLSPLMTACGPNDASSAVHLKMPVFCLTNIASDTPTITPSALHDDKNAFPESIQDLNRNMLNNLQSVDIRVIIDGIILIQLS